MQRLNDERTNGEEVQLYPYGYWSESISESDRDEIISLLCEKLKVSIFRTNFTKHGAVEIVLKDDGDESK